MNSRKLNDADAQAERERVSAETGLPTCDVIRHGATDLVDAIARFRSQEWRAAS
jgi:uncharacterized NAD-dependent epimerase/dehydratase family protein